MKNRIYLLALLMSVVAVAVFLEIYLSGRVKDLTTINYACFLNNTKKCKITLYTEDHNMIEQNFYPEKVINKEYSFTPSENDKSNDKIYKSSLVQREANLLNHDMYFLANQYKDLSFSKLDRAHDFYPSRYRRDMENLNILAVSDSYGVGAGLVNNLDSWPGVLEYNLLAKGVDVEVSKFAKNGADFPDYLEMLSRENITLLDPDIIIISLFQNDFSPISWLSKPVYLKCLSVGFGGNIVDRFFRRKIPYIYSYVLNRKCDPDKLESELKNKSNNEGHLTISLKDDPLAVWYKDVMKEILNNAQGRPVIIQPIFTANKASYDNIREALEYLKSIGFIVPEINKDEVLNYAKNRGAKKIEALHPVDTHSSRLYNNYLTKMSISEVEKIIYNDKNFSKTTPNLGSTPSILNTFPRSFISDESLLVQYERRNTPIIVNKLSPELMRGGVLEGDFIDEVLCSSNNRGSVKLYLNQIKHAQNSLSIEIKSSESEVAVSGIYYSSEGEELFTEISILKPGDKISFSFEQKIIGLLFGAPLSGCAENELWSMPSFLAQISYN